MTPRRQSLTMFRVRIVEPPQGDPRRTTISGVATSVLIVDDHAEYRAFARRLLEAGGFAVVGEAADAAGAAAQVERLEPKVVLLDIGLPDADGIDVARRLAGDQDTTAVVLVSSRDESAYGGRIGGSGARGFIPKAELSAKRLRSLLGDTA